MSSFRKSLAATAGLVLVIGLIALFTPSGTRGQSGGLTLPFYGKASHDKAAFNVQNDAPTGTGVHGAGRQGVVGQATNMNGVGVMGVGDMGDNSSGVHGRAHNGYGVYGRSVNNIGVLGLRGEDFDNFQTRGILGTIANAVEGVSKVAGGKGVAGVAHSGANAAGVYGESKGVWPASSGVG